MKSISHAGSRHQEETPYGRSAAATTLPSSFSML
jgi:hypothetical protein